ncbi:MAG: GTP-binding protein, partial [Phycisphaerales bacterium]
MSAPNHSTTAPAETRSIRNIVFAGHGGSGKTTLVERILAHTKAIAKMGSIAEGNTVCDYEPEEKHHKHSLTSSIAHCTFDGHSLNLIDTPGAGDFFGHVVSVL